MLKLERTNKDHTIHIRLRDKDKLWNRSFLFAFSLALIIHVLAIVMIHVHPIATTGEEVILPPVAVNADIHPSQNEYVLAHIKENKPKKHYLFEPKQPEPQLPEVPLSIPPQHFEYAFEPSVPHHPFPHYEESLPPEPQCTPSPRLHISGPLAENGLITYDLPQNIPAAKYTVRVDASKGTILWFQRTDQDTNNPALEKILTTLLFDTTPSAFIITGEIEFLGEPS